ncbi:hypothetical protein O9993_10015 [Vibrio lentus]|nr:hypothetical protein [Vibrio lentus]
MISAACCVGSRFRSYSRFLFVICFDTQTLLVWGVAAANLAIKRRWLYSSKQGYLLTLSNVCGALLGTSNTTSYVESVAGVAAEGGRTGLTAVVVGMLLLRLFLLATCECDSAYTNIRCTFLILMMSGLVSIKLA